MIDTHCHLTFRNYAGRVDEVIADARAAGVGGMITISTTFADARAALDIARQHDNVWCSAGVHPLHCDDDDIAPPRDWSRMLDVARDPNCVAWGELGLDHHYDKPDRTLQETVLHEQLEFIKHARDEHGINKPIVVHCRKAFDALLPILRASGLPADRFVFHCFTGSVDDARAVLDFGGWISFTGIVTFANAREVADAAKIVPVDRMMAETDAPFLSPEPVRTTRPNEPKYVVHIARFLADLHSIDHATFEKQLDDNAERFFDVRVVV